MMQNLQEKTVLFCGKYMVNAKKDKRISDLEERLAESKESRYVRRCQKLKQSKRGNESGNSCKESGNGNDNLGGADSQQGEGECVAHPGSCYRLHLATD